MSKHSSPGIGGPRAWWREDDFGDARRIAKLGGPDSPGAIKAREAAKQAMREMFKREPARCPWDDWKPGRDVS